MFTDYLGGGFWGQLPNPAEDEDFWSQPQPSLRPVRKGPLRRVSNTLDGELRELAPFGLTDQLSGFNPVRLSFGEWSQQSRWKRSSRIWG